MKQGKKICEVLKSVRMDVARANGIDYQPAECRHEGDCAGTCPRCEHELRMIERQIETRRHAGKAAVVAGVSLGLMGLTGCGSCRIQKDDVPEKLDGEVMVVPDDWGETAADTAAIELPGTAGDDSEYLITGKTD